MWVGSTLRSAGPFNTFNGFLSQLICDDEYPDPQVTNVAITPTEYTSADAGETILKKVWDAAPIELRGLKSEGELVFFVTSDVYTKYEESLDAVALEAAYIARQQGRGSLSWRGIPVVDMKVSHYLNSVGDLGNTWAVLTDRRNLALAVNTADFPGTEVRMWYNPDEMQNRQRAVFAAGCEYLLPELICYGYKS